MKKLAPLWLKSLVRVFRLMRVQFGANIFLAFPHLSRILQQYFQHAETQNNSFHLSLNNFSPYMLDNIDHTPLEPVYFYQDTWAAEKIFQSKPTHHVDIGSRVMSMAIISRLIKTTLVDIRPPELTLKGLEYIKGSILELPFPDNSLLSISSLCVIEHIGLGRYGDPIDAFGTEKSCQELSRVLAPGGSLYISLPVDDLSKVYFNDCRSFTRDHVLRPFPDLQLVSEAYQYDNQLLEQYIPEKGFGTGLFHFKAL